MEKASWAYFLCSVSGVSFAVKWIANIHCDPKLYVWVYSLSHHSACLSASACIMSFHIYVLCCWIRSVKPLLSPSELSTTEHIVKDFSEGDGQKLQKMLENRAKSMDSWVWHCLMYLLH